MSPSESLLEPAGYIFQGFNWILQEKTSLTVSYMKKYEAQMMSKYSSEW